LAGYNYYGNEPLYSGITGTEFHADIYLGVRPQAHKRTGAQAHRDMEASRAMHTLWVYAHGPGPEALCHSDGPRCACTRHRHLRGGGIISARRERQGEGEGPMSCRSWAYGCAVRSACAVLLTMGWACAGGVLSAPAAHGFGQVPSTHDRARPQPHPATRQGVCAREPRPPSAPPP
jgi:hypothetical protein